MMEFARWLRQKREKTAIPSFVAKQLHISRQESIKMGKTGMLDRLTKCYIKFLLVSVYRTRNQSVI